MFDEIHEECGVFGIFSKDPEIKVVEEAYLALFALQHRGQESCGIAVNDGGVIVSYKDLGLVPDVFNPVVMKHLEGGSMAVGHCRYATSKSANRENAQPLVSKYKKGTLALAYNGTLVNSAELRAELESTGAIFQTTNDAEIMLYLLARERINCPSIEMALKNVMKKLKGAYSLVLMSPSKLIAARDPKAIRPLCMGKIGESIVFASESCAFDTLGAEFIRDVEPGEIIVVSNEGITELKDESIDKSKCGLCCFEYIYTARPDSVIDGASVHFARQEAGRSLAKAYPVEADLVCGVPDSGLDAALGYALESGIPYGVGFIKNRYIGRTFIQSTQAQRERSVKIKLNILKSAVEGKRVVVVDDSIVRGTTTANTIKLLREAGAKEIHMRIASPPFINPCYFGTDIESKENLIACRLTIDEICKQIGADTFCFLDVDSVFNIAKGCKLGLCAGCFTGKYPIEIPTNQTENKYQQKIK
ncbi:MAG: amidophosphoribosyltransferase [Ruminococcaceae bacterium]|nr:amidophosphoribosyltransferase [Oscillospiraceae bacterium]